MKDTTTHDLTPSGIENLGDPYELPGIIAILGELKPGAIITEEGAAHLFGRHVASVKRAVQRGELPPPSPLRGQCLDSGGFGAPH